jgi:hypothetical protein
MLSEPLAATLQVTRIFFSRETVLLTDSKPTGEKINRSCLGQASAGLGETELLERVFLDAES